MCGDLSRGGAPFAQIPPERIPPRARRKTGRGHGAAHPGQEKRQDGTETASVKNGRKGAAENFFEKI